MHLKQLFQVFILTVLIQFCPVQNALNASEKLSDANLPTNDANSAETIKLFTSLVDGRKNAAKTDTAQLLILTNELQPVHEEYIKNLFSNLLFINPAQKSMTVIKLDFPLKKKSTKEEFKAVSEFVKNYKIKKSPLQFLLINSKTGEEVFSGNLPADTPEVLAKKISLLLPDKYNGQWIDNFKAAKMIAQKTGKHMLINFTGSDWCVWCKRLKQEVFEQEAFKEYARKKLVLVEVDFPRAKTLPKKTLLENNKLAEKFGIRGYPSIIILNPDEKVIGTTGYVQGGLDEFLAGLKQMIGN